MTKASFHKSALLPLEPGESPEALQALAPARHKLALSLFWRTFMLLALLLVGSVVAWTHTLRAMELEPRAMQTAQQIASVVNLSRAAVMHTDRQAQASLFKTMQEREHLTLRPREPGDQFEPLNHEALSQHLVQQLQLRLGPDTVVAGSVNQQPGLWVGFAIDQDRYWLRTDRERFDQPAGQLWLVSLLTATVLSLAGAAGMARLINRPLKDLALAAGRVREGDFEATALDETASTQEIRAVNVGFNRMTRKLAQMEQNRTVMLAGISHDLRTPLARLRLETELSVKDPQARDNMASDIAQLDAIIGKFLDYARPGSLHLQPVSLNQTVQACLEPLRKRHDMIFKVALQDGLMVLADPVELQRVLGNLLENAARYGQTPDTEVARIEISARYRDDKVQLRLRDRGPGVPPEQLKHLTTPFYRGEAARTSAHLTSTGLGLAIVEQTIARMGGVFDLSNANSGGLCANIVLQRASGDASQARAVA